MSAMTATARTVCQRGLREPKYSSPAPTAVKLYAILWKMCGRRRLNAASTSTRMASILVRPSKWGSRHLFSRSLDCSLCTALHHQKDFHAIKTDPPANRITRQVANLRLDAAIHRLTHHVPCRVQLHRPHQRLPPCLL